ncbi:hypothetical protein FB567DRAFT_614340 [Paraphoma chrysanthemicola]|uniref:SET domain-containing protein n=1 Tax=Paraphoma chrysanthemicola TaxID=798071 RepID=A0A8K0RDL6_9PLEO|nr:hypothetical protein FB567DRAFT_614340 [Paraphoma chrysanthemicola]
MSRLLILTSLAFLLYLPNTSATLALTNLQTLLQQHPLPQTPAQNTPSHAPWSHSPHCTTSHHLAHLGQKFCIYTSNTTGPYGLSLILKPRDAVRATAHLSDNPLESFLTKRQAESMYLGGVGGGQAWKVVDVPGKDKGVVATRRIARFETVMVDQAAVVVDMDLEKAVMKGESNAMLKLAVERLRAPGVIRDMSAKHNDGKDEEEVEGEEGRLEEDVMKTNAFGSTVVDVSTRALFPLISRINHACNPNSFVMFSRAGVSMAIKAYRDIEEGEEITISYLLLGIPSHKRTHLLSRWGFTCTCALCSLPPQEKKASDLRRVMIAQAEEKIIQLAESYDLPAAIALTHESIQMIIEEEVYPMLTDEYAMLAMLYLEHGDRKSAEKYGKLAWGLLGDLGFLGVGEEKDRQTFTLERLLGNMGKLGGDGSGGKWKKGEV